jgi:hypothetical protein
MKRHATSARAFAFILLVVALAWSLAACSGSSKPKSALGSSSAPVAAPKPSSADPAPWPAPSDPMTRARAAGLVPETAEQLQYHVHSHLDVFLDGKHVLVPAGLGIDIANPGVHQFTTDGLPSYGGIAVPCDRPCISPLHTHDVSGILHTESSTQQDNLLGQIFVEWNVRLDANCVATYCKPAKSVAVYVDGSPFAGNPQTIPLSDHKEIAIVIGAPPAQIPNTADWTQI